MRDGRNESPPRFPHSRQEQHERAWPIELEPLGGVLGQNAGRVWTIGLAEFHRAVEMILHPRQTRVGHDRSVSQCARPELGAAVEPRDDLPVGDEVAHVRRRSRLVSDVEVREDLVNLLIPIAPAGIGVSQGDACAPGRFGLENVEVPPQCEAEGNSGVRAAWLHPEFLDRRFLQDAKVGGAVEGDASRETQTFAAGLLVRVRRHADELALALLLNIVGRTRRVGIRDSLPILAALHAFGDQPGVRKAREEGAVVGGHPVVDRTEVEDRTGLALAVRGQAHDFPVALLGSVRQDGAGDQGVEPANAPRAAPLDLLRAVVRHVEQRLGIQARAHAIDDEHGRLVEA